MSPTIHTRERPTYCWDLSRRLGPCRNSTKHQRRCRRLLSALTPRVRSVKAARSRQYSTRLPPPAKRNVEQDSTKTLANQMCAPWRQGHPVPWLLNRLLDFIMLRNKTMVYQWLMLPLSPRHNFPAASPNMPPVPRHLKKEGPKRIRPTSLMWSTAWANRNWKRSRRCSSSQNKRKAFPQTTSKTHTRTVHSRNKKKRVSRCRRKWIWIQLAWAQAKWWHCRRNSRQKSQPDWFWSRSWCSSRWPHKIS